jgi:simple sugar transport system ATP-binding protein
VIHAGEVVGLTGLIGAGRTELGLSLFGMTRPDRGTIRLNGQPVAFRSNRDAIRAGIAYVSEDRLTLGLVQPQPIADNIVLPVLGRIVNGSTSSRPARRRPRRSLIRERRSRSASLKTRSRRLGGNQQRIVPRWLATEPKLLILDLPTVGVDVGARAGHRHRAEPRREGPAILLISTRCLRSISTDRIHMAAVPSAPQRAGAGTPRRRSGESSSPSRPVTIVLILVCAILPS